MACCKCCCGNKDCSNGGKGKCCCGGTSGTCCETNEICCDGSCTSNPTCSKSGSGTVDLDECETYTGFAYTIFNTCCCEATITVTGMANDEVYINGQIYGAGTSPFNWPNTSNPCGRSANDNGTHEYTYTKTLAVGASIYIGGRDNGFGGSVTYNYSFACNPLP